MRQIKATIFFIVLFFGLNYHALSQCVIGNFDIPECIQAGIPVTFTNTSIDNNNGPYWYCNNTAYYWSVFDNTGTNIYANSFTPSFNLTNFTFPSAGNYTVDIYPYLPMPFWQQDNCCPGNGWWFATTVGWQETVTVVDSLLEIQSNDSISICAGSSGGSIDTSDLNLQINHSVGPLDFKWIGIPSGNQFYTVNPSGINQNDNQIKLVVTDLASGCSDSTIISLSIAQTTLDAGFTSIAVNGSTGCSNDSLIFIANDSSSSVSWYINNNSRYQASWLIITFTNHF